MTHDQSGDNSSDSGGFTAGRPGKRLSMPRFPVARATEQIEADHEFAEKLVEEERLMGSGLMEVPGDEEFTMRLQEEMEEAKKSGGDPDAVARAMEVNFGDTASSTEDEEWKVNRGEVRMTLEELSGIRKKYGIPAFVGMRANLPG